MDEKGDYGEKHKMSNSKEDFEAPAKEPQSLLNINKASIDDKALPHCYGEYDNDPFGHCFGCFVSLACARTQATERP